MKKVKAIPIQSAKKKETLKYIDDLRSEVEKGEVNNFVCLMKRKDGRYVSVNTGSDNHHEMAGQLIELAIRMLAFMQKKE